jgi:hypothetical protein
MQILAYILAIGIPEDDSVGVIKCTCTFTNLGVHFARHVSIEDEAYETQTHSLSPGDNLGLPLGVCVFITAVTILKLFAWGEGDSGGHVLRETTSPGLYL